MKLEKYVCHSARVWRIAETYGWQPGARYTNLRDVRHADRVGFLDIDWKNYDFSRHLAAAKAVRPKLTVAQDVIDVARLPEILDQAMRLLEYSDDVIVVPKDLLLDSMDGDTIPTNFILGYSVPTKYGGTELPVGYFSGRKVHLLGGRPDKQRELAKGMHVVSIDTNRFTLDAAYGDYFDGKKFVQHPRGGYENCIHDSIRNINSIWSDYRIPAFDGVLNDAA